MSEKEIKDFCNNLTYDKFKKFNGRTKFLFFYYSNICVSQNIGNIKIAKHILGYKKRYGKIRVGGSKRTKGYARKDGYTNLPIISRGPAPWNQLSPFYLGPVKDPNVEIEANNAENFWQFLKVYPQVKKIRLTKGKGKNRYVEWEYPTETHAVLKSGLDRNNFESWKVLPEWKKWRNAGFKNKYAIRRPNGTVAKNGPPIFALYNDERLGYVDSRKKIYIPTYSKLFKNHKLFNDIMDKLFNGENIMLIDIDGPDVELYPEGREMSIKLLDEMVEDTRRPYGHGFAAAKTLLNELGIFE